jgi:hypothetical protein
VSRTKQNVTESRTSSELILYDPCTRPPTYNACPVTHITRVPLHWQPPPTTTKPPNSHAQQGGSAGCLGSCQTRTSDAAEEDACHTSSKLILYDPCYTSAHQSRTTDGLQRHVSSHTPVYRLTGDLHLPLPSLPTRMRNRAAARGYFGSCQTRTSNAAKKDACHILRPPTIFVWWGSNSAWCSTVHRETRAKHKPEDN